METYTTMEKSIKNIVFDLGGVLTELNGQQCIEAFEQIGAHDIVPYVRDHRTEDLFLDAELGRIDWREFCMQFRNLTGCQAEDHQIVWAWNQLLTPIPDNKKRILRQLRQQYRVFLLSNTNDMHWNRVEKEFLKDSKHAAADYFDGVYLSYEMHLAKPSEKIFRVVLEDADLQPEETLFIDDTQENCDTARRLGIHTLLNESINYWTDKL